MRPTFTQEECEIFVDAADPHQWFLKACNLHEQACYLWSARGRGNIAFIDKDGKRTMWDSTNRSVFLLAAFAMENMLKAFLVYEAPQYVADRYLKGITTHDLPALARSSSLVPYRDTDMWVFEALSDGNENWARYPCGRNANDVQRERSWSPELWFKYNNMIQTYARKMQKLLAKGWWDLTAIMAPGPRIGFNMTETADKSVIQSTSWASRDAPFVQLWPTNNQCLFSGKSQPKF